MVKYQSNTTQLVTDLASQPGRAQQWRRCKHLIIDEISMVNTTYFDKLEAVACAVRKKENIPFGGILILSGDFLQLPPVTKQQGPKKFCFQVKNYDPLTFHPKTGQSDFIQATVMRFYSTFDFYCNYFRQKVGVNVLKQPECASWKVKILILASSLC